MSRWRRAGRGLAVVALLWMIFAWTMVDRAASGRTFDAVADVPARHAGVVLGCSRSLPNGQRNLFFVYRIQAAAALFHAGKVRYLIVSGDRHGANYDEPGDMKRSLVEAGVPAERIYCDAGGFSTGASMLRARWLYGETSFTVISQRFHTRRAVWIARHSGIDAVGLNAADVTQAGSFLTMVRETVARSALVLNLLGLRHSDAPAGPRVHIPA